MRSTRLAVEGANGAQLSARLDLPADNAPLAYALFAHCFTCSKDLNAVVSIARELTYARVGVLRFDFTGLGESEGEFATTGFTSNVEDLVAVARFMERDLAAPALLIGHSLGGAAALQAAPRLTPAPLVATIGAPYDPAYAAQLFHHVEDTLREAGEANVTLAGRTFRVTRELVEDLQGPHMLDAIGRLDRPLLVMHSPRDELVGIDHAARIYSAARHPKSFVSLDQADHLLSAAVDARYAGRVIAAWASRYLPQPEPRPRERLHDSRTVARIGASGYRAEIVANGHSLVADEPQSVGGTDEGPTPYSLLAAALGACTAMTLRMYADRHQWPLDEVLVALTHHKVHALDEEHCESRAARLDEIEREITVAGQLTDAQRARLLEIADRCPVHRTLDAGVRISSRLIAPVAPQPQPPGTGTPESARHGA